MAARQSSRLPSCAAGAEEGADSGTEDGAEAGMLAGSPEEGAGAEQPASRTAQASAAAKMRFMDFTPLALPGKRAGRFVAL